MVGGQTKKQTLVTLRTKTALDHSLRAVLVLIKGKPDRSVL